MQSALGSRRIASHPNDFKQVTKDAESLKPNSRSPIPSSVLNFNQNRACYNGDDDYLQQYFKSCNHPFDALRSLCCCESARHAHRHDHHCLLNVQVETLHGNEIDAMIHDGKVEWVHTRDRYRIKYIIEDQEKQSAYIRKILKDLMVSTIFHDGLEKLHSSYHKWWYTGYPVEDIFGQYFTPFEGTSKAMENQQHCSKCVICDRSSWVSKPVVLSSISDKYNHLLLHQSIYSVGFSEVKYGRNSEATAQLIEKMFWCEKEKKATRKTWRRYSLHDTEMDIQLMHRRNSTPPYRVVQLPTEVWLIKTLPYINCPATLGRLMQACRSMSEPGSFQESWKKLCLRDFPNLFNKLGCRWNEQGCPHDSTMRIFTENLLQSGHLVSNCPNPKESVPDWIAQYAMLKLREHWKLDYGFMTRSSYSMPFILSAPDMMGLRQWSVDDFIETLGATRIPHLKDQIAKYDQERKVEGHSNVICLPWTNGFLKGGLELCGDPTHLRVKNLLDEYLHEVKSFNLVKTEWYSKLLIIAGLSETGHFLGVLVCNDD